MADMRDLHHSLLGPKQWPLLVPFGLVIYLALVRLLRFQRAQQLPRKFQMTRRDTFKTMTADQAQDVLKYLTELEFPKFMGFSIVFALFKVDLYTKSQIKARPMLMLA